LVGTEKSEVWKLVVIRVDYKPKFMISHFGLTLQYLFTFMQWILFLSHALMISFRRKYTVYPEPFLFIP